MAHKFFKILHLFRKNNVKMRKKAENFGFLRDEDEQKARFKMRQN